MSAGGNRAACLVLENTGEEPASINLRMKLILTLEVESYCRASYSWALPAFHTSMDVWYLIINVTTLRPLPIQDGEVPIAVTLNPRHLF